MTAANRDELRAEALFQQAFAESATAGHIDAHHFVGVAFKTASGEIFGGHANLDDIESAAHEALHTCHDVSSLSEQTPAPLEIVSAAIVTESNLDEVGEDFSARLRVALNLSDKATVALWRNHVLARTMALA